MGADLALHRLITLSGPGGVGKSRLGAEVAEHAAAARGGAVWWIDLKPLQPGAEVTPAVLGALRLPDVSGRSALDQLAAFFGTRGALLVLDNGEHVLAGCRRIVTDLLGVSASLVVLVTSRAALGVTGERVREVGPLELPDRTAPAGDAMRSPAARLFLDRVRDVQADFVVDASVARDVVEICHRLDGLPLALELAAAGVPGQTLAQIRSALGGAAPGWEPSARAAGSHPALVGCIRWSYDLLTEREQVLLRRLSVFAGAFTTEAVTAVCSSANPDPGWPADALAGLVAKSLVRRASGGRFLLLETVRGFAADVLAAVGEEAQTRERHLTYALAVADRTEHDLIGANAAVVDRLVAGLDDQRAALGRALADPDAERALRIAAACGFVLIHRGRYHEAGDLVGRALARPGGTAAARVQAHFVAGFAAGHLSDRAAMSDAVAGSQHFAEQDGRPRALGRARMVEGWNHYHDTPGESLVPLREALRWAEEADDTWMLLDLPCELAMQAVRADDHATALAWVERGCGPARGRGNDYVLAWLLVLAGACHLRRGALPKAREATQEAGELARSVGESVSMAYADYVLAETELTAGRPDQARIAAQRGLAACERSQTLAGREALLSQLAQARIAMGSRDAPADLAAAVRAIDQVSDPWEHCPAALALVSYRAAIGDAAGAVAPLAGAARTGQRLGSPWVAAKVAALEGVLALGAYPAVAVDRLHAAVALATEHAFDLIAVDAAEALALECVLRGRFDRAARLLGAAEHHRTALGAPRSLLAQTLHTRTIELLGAAPDAAAVSAAAAEAAELTLHQVLSHLLRGRGARSRTAIGWTSLTNAEREVADLAAEGLSNPAIAARLLVAPGTVKTHLGRIYAKLGVANRTELATTAARRTRDHHASNPP